MIGFGLGWALLALLSMRLTNQPQRWAMVPAAYFLLIGAGLLVFAPSSDTVTLLGWVWPPALLAMALSLVRLGVFPLPFALTVHDEFAEMPTALEQGAALTSLGDRPLIVVTAAQGLKKAGCLSKSELNLSTKSVQQVLADATHASLIEDESDAAAASQAIVDAIESVRTGTQLADS